MAIWKIHFLYLHMSRTHCSYPSRIFPLLMWFSLLPDQPVSLWKKIPQYLAHEMCSTKRMIFQIQMAFRTVPYQLAVCIVCGAHTYNRTFDLLYIFTGPSPFEHTLWVSPRDSIQMNECFQLPLPQLAACYKSMLQAQVHDTSHCEICPTVPSHTHSHLLVDGL